MVIKIIIAGAFVKLFIIVISFFYFVTAFCFSDDIRANCVSLKNQILVIVKESDYSIEIWNMQNAQKIADLPSNLETTKCAINDDGSLIALVAHKQGELWKKYEDGWQKYDFILSKPLSRMDDISCNHININTNKKSWVVNHIYPCGNGLMQEKISLSQVKKVYYPINLDQIKPNFLSKYNVSADKVIMTYLLDNKATHLLIYDLKKKKIIFTYVILARVYYVNFAENDKKCLLVFNNQDKIAHLAVIDLYTYHMDNHILGDSIIMDIYLSNNELLWMLTNKSVTKTDLSQKIKSKI